MGGGKLQAHIPSNGPARDIPKPREGLGTGNGEADAHRSGWQNAKGALISLPIWVSSAWLKGWCSQSKGSCGNSLLGHLVRTPGGQLGGGERCPSTGHPSGICWSKLFTFVFKIKLQRESINQHTMPTWHYWYFLLMFAQSSVKSHNEGALPPRDLALRLPTAASCLKVSFKYFIIPSCTLICFTMLIIYQWTMTSADT